MEKWVDKGVVEIINRGLIEYSKSGIGFTHIEEWSDLFLGLVCYYGSPNDFADTKYKKCNKWEIGLSEDFYDSLDSIDNKLRGKLWDIIKKIRKNPMKPMGNTIKPLTGDLKNLWRYRMGDWRLVYKPNNKYNHILLLYLKHRKNVYS